MVIKSEEHRKFLLELMQQVQYPGAALDIAYEVKKEIERAEVKNDDEGAQSFDGAR